VLECVHRVRAERLTVKDNMGRERVSMGCGQPLTHNASETKGQPEGDDPRHRGEYDQPRASLTSRETAPDLVPDDAHGDAHRRATSFLGKLRSEGFSLPTEALLVDAIYETEATRRDTNLVAPSRIVGPAADSRSPDHLPGSRRGGGSSVRCVR
jgi:hypothetical protein